MIGLFSAVRKDYGPAGIRVELGHVGMLPVWEENNRNGIAAGRTKTPIIEPNLIDRQLPLLTAKLDELDKAAGLSPANATAQPGGPAGEGSAPVTKAPAPDLSGAQLTAEQKKEFIELTDQVKLLTDRRNLILARTGDEYVTAPPKMASK